MSDLARRPGSAIERGAAPGFGAGLRSFFGGFGFVLGNPGVWPLAAVPVVIALGLTSLLAWGAIGVVPGWIAAWIGTPGVLTTLAQIAAGIVAVVLAILVGFALAQPLSGPALEKIVRRVEASLGAPAWPAQSVLSEIGRSLSSVIVGLAFGLPVLALLFLVDLVFSPAVVVTVPLKVIVTALLIAWDLCDYPLSIRGLPVGARVAFMRRHSGAMIGFGAGLALLSTFLPCVVLLLLPAGVAGATRLIVELERWDRG